MAPAFASDHGVGVGANLYQSTDGFARSVDDMRPSESFRKATVHHLLPKGLIFSKVKNEWGPIQVPTRPVFPKSRSLSMKLGESQRERILRKNV